MVASCWKWRETSFINELPRKNVTCSWDSWGQSQAKPSQAKPKGKQKGRLWSSQIKNKASFYCVISITQIPSWTSTPNITTVNMSTPDLQASTERCGSDLMLSSRWLVSWSGNSAPGGREFFMLELLGLQISVCLFIQPSGWFVYEAATKIS